MRLVALRGRAMAEASAATPTGMSAVLGGDPADVLATLERHGLTPANVNGAGQVVAAGTLDALAALAADPPAKARVIPLKVAGAFHTELHAAGRRRPRRGRRRPLPRRRPRPARLQPRRRASSPAAARSLDRLVARCRNPVRWDLCMEAVRRPRRHRRSSSCRPAGTLVGLAKRALKGVELLARQDARTTSTPPAPSSRSTVRHDPSTPKGYRPALRRPGHELARITGIGGYRPAPRRPQHRARRARSTPPTSGSASAPASSSGASPARARRSSTCPCSPPRRRSRWPASPPSDLDAVIVATVTWPYQTPAAAPMLAERLGMQGRRLRHLRRLRRVLPRHLARPRHGAQRHRPQRPRRRGRAALRLHLARRPRHGLHLRRRRGRGGRQPVRHRRASARRSGARTARSGRPSRRPSRWIDVHEKKLGWPHIGMAGPDRLPLGRLGHGSGRPAGARRRRRHRRPARRVHPAPGQRAHHRRDGQAAQAARPTSPSPATSPTPATPPPPRSHWRWSGWCGDGEIPSGGLALQIGFGAGLSYAAQVVVIP